MRFEQPEECERERGNGEAGAAKLVALLKDQYEQAKKDSDTQRLSDLLEACPELEPPKPVELPPEKQLEQAAQNLRRLTAQQERLTTRL